MIVVSGSGPVTCVRAVLAVCLFASFAHARAAATALPGSESWGLNLVAKGEEAWASPPAPDAPSTLLGLRPPLPSEGSAGRPWIKAQRPNDKVLPEGERNFDCEKGVLHGKACRVSWARVIPESMLFMAAQHGGNIWMDRDTRYNLTHGSFWNDYVYCVEKYRWSRWKDDDPFGVDFLGHPMMGSLTSSIYEQNDPKQRALSFENTRRYWMGRLRAMAYTAAYSAQWKVGPVSEASIGNTGIGYYVRNSDGVWTNGTGMQDFFVTPIGGLAWNVGEDAIDRYIFSHVRHAQKHRIVLFVASFMTPTRSAANVTRLRAPYYRDPVQVGENRGPE